MTPSIRHVVMGRPRLRTLRPQSARHCCLLSLFSIWASSWRYTGELGRPRARRRAHPHEKALWPYLFGLLFIVAIHVSQANDLTACIARRVTFDGIAPLQYATAIVRAGERLYLYREFPGRCGAQEAITCRGQAYVLAGDTVAVGKECGKWAYVQYIGSKSITTGWVTSLKLATITPPPKATPYVRQMGHYRVVEKPRRYAFKLLQGAGQPVCEAYLQRLNQTPFYAPPYCGRPESKTVPGFAWLTRIPLTPAQTAALYPRLYSFKLARQSEPPRPLDSTDTAIGESGGSGPSIFAWRYGTGVDIGNDRVLRNVVVWAGSPFTSFYAPCGSQQLWAGRQETVRWAQLAFIATQDTKSIDDSLTLKIFGSPTDGLPIGSPQHAPWIAFIPIGDSFSIFKFNRRTYYDTFYAGGGWPDFYGRRAKGSSLSRHLAVFLRRREETREVCEYTYHG